MKEYLTKEQTNQIFNVNTANGCREMKEDRFHQAVNEAIHQAIQVQAKVSPKVADIDKGLGKCVEKNCNKFATTDYNGHKHYVCNYHYEKLTREFEEDYD